MEGMLFFIIVIIAVIGFAIYIKVPSKEEKEEKQKLLNEYEDIFKKNQEEIEEISTEKYVEDNDMGVAYDDGYAPGFTFVKNNAVCFLEKMIPIYAFENQTIQTMKEYIRQPLRLEIKFDEIKYYEQTGNVENRQEITGTGGGSSLGGAVLGGLVAGGAGAIIGSRKDIEINTNYHSIDTRMLIVKTNDNKTYKFFGWQIYNALFDLIPEKEHSVYKEKLSQTNNTQNPDSNISQLEDLANLRDKGIITEQEFEESKKKILSKL